MLSTWQRERLVCPKCGQKIAALPGDRVFACGQCEDGFELNSSGNREQFTANQVYEGWWLQRRTSGSAGRERGELVYLPFWRFELSSSPAAVLPASLPPRLNPRERRVFIYSPAFQTNSLTTTLELITTLSNAQRTYEVNAGADSRGAVYTSYDAEVTLEFAIKLLATQSEILTLAGSLPHRRGEILSIPFERHGEELFDSLTGLRITG